MDLQSALTPDIQNLLKPENLPILIAAFILGLVIIAGLLADTLLLVYLRIKPLDQDKMAARMRALPWDWRAAGTVILALVALHGCILLGFSLLGWFGVLEERTLTSTAVFVQSLLLPSVVVVVILVLIRLYGRSWRDTLGLRGSTVSRDVLLAGFLYLATMPVMAFYSMMYLKVLQFLRFPVFRQDVVRFLIDSNQPIWIRAHLVVMAVVAAPVVEEIFFRGIALPAAARHLRPMPAACLVSLLFAVMHFHIPSIVPLFVIAMSFSLAYLRTGSLMVPIVMHAIFNCVSITAMIMLRNVQDALPF